MPTIQDTRNQATWSRRSSRRWLAAGGTFTDPGERAVFDRIREHVRGGSVLDLGVGTGRTVPLFTALTKDYVGVDYLQPMVDACRARHPGVRVELGDARNLRSMPNEQFAVVNFSFNGIDAVGHEHRRQVLDEMRRVVRADGCVVFSTLNLDGPAFRERPWAPEVAPARNPLRRAARATRAWATMPLDVVRWARLQPHVEQGSGWAVAPLSAHHYGVMAHFTSLARQLTELSQAGLDRDVLVVENTVGARVEPHADTSESAWFHVMARKR
jgi:SAM-dependent methyltransferase